MSRLIVGALLVAAILAVSSGGAAAIDNTLQFTVAQGVLALSSAGDGTTVVLQNGGADPTFDAGSDTTVQATMPDATVTDNRGTLGGWTVTVSASGDFSTGGATPDTVARAQGRVYIDATDAASYQTQLTSSGRITAMTLSGGEFAGGSNNLGSNGGSGYTLLSGSSTSLASTPTVTYTPTASVVIPAGTPPGTYSTTVTQTVS